MSPMLYNFGMTKVSTAVARKQFSDMVNRASYAKERVALTRYGKTLAAIVPAEDLAWLEAMEDRIDSEDAEKALAEMKTKGEKPIPWASVKKRLGM
jgi:prevent-host-death family protein